MLEDEEMRDFLEEAKSQKRKEDFEIMRKNASTHHLSPDDFLRFLTQFSRAFGPLEPGAHESPVDNGKFLI